MFSKGADVDALHDSAGRMALFGREVDVVRAHGQRAVSTMERAWQGPDLQHLVERWRRVEHDLHRISTEFDQLSRRLHDNADLQHRSGGSSRGAELHVPGRRVGIVGWGPGSGRPLVPSGLPQAVHAVGWGHRLGRPPAEAAAFEPLSFGPGLPAGIAAAAAQDLGLPSRARQLR